jgi:hypothetical protein
MSRGILKTRSLLACILRIFILICSPSPPPSPTRGEGVTFWIVTKVPVSRISEDDLDSRETLSFRPPAFSIASLKVGECSNI